jgi:hypothetical protein
MYEVSQALVKVFEAQPVLLERQSDAVQLLCGQVQESYRDSPEVRAWLSAERLRGLLPRSS